MEIYSLTAHSLRSFETRRTQKPPSLLAPMANTTLHRPVGKTNQEFIKILTEYVEFLTQFKRKVSGLDRLLTFDIIYE